jgi:hypothetical protein
VFDDILAWNGRFKRRRNVEANPHVMIIFRNPPPPARVALCEQQGGGARQRGRCGSGSPRTFSARLDRDQGVGAMRLSIKVDPVIAPERLKPRAEPGQMQDSVKGWLSWQDQTHRHTPQTLKTAPFAKGVRSGGVGRGSRPSPDDINLAILNPMTGHR